jgi:Glycosyltransferase family 87
MPLKPALIEADIPGVSSVPDRRRTALSIALIAAACAGLALLVRGLTGSGDYFVSGPVIGDNAGPALNALAHGHLAAMVRSQPLMGLASILLRAPVVALAGTLHGSERLAYGLGCLACFLPAAALVAWFARRAVSAPQLVMAAIGCGAIVAGPATLQAARVGHPEEVLATVLAAGAVICAMEDRRRSAAVLLGLAIGTKQWAFLATPCVLLALPDSRAAVATKAFLVAAPLVAFLPLADPAAFARADTSVGGLRVADAFSVWYSASSISSASLRAFVHGLPLGLTRSQAAAIGLLVAGTIIAIYVRRIRRDGPLKVDPLVLLALCGLVRCVADPTPLDYNFVAVVIPLAVWEAGVAKRLPVVTALTCVALGLLVTNANVWIAGRGGVVGEPLLSWLWLAGVIALGCYLTRAAFRPRALAPAPVRPAPSRLAAAVDPS